MRSLKDYGIDKRFNKQESPLQKQNTQKLSEGWIGRNIEQSSIVKPSINNQSSSPAQRLSLITNRDNNYSYSATTNRTPYINRSPVISPFEIIPNIAYQKPKTINEKPERFNYQEYKNQRNEVNKYEKDCFYWGALLIAGIVFLPSIFFLSLLTSTLLLGLGVFSLYAKSSNLQYNQAISGDIPIPKITITLFVLIAWTVDCFVRLDPTYEGFIRLIYAFPIGLYIFSLHWQELLICKTPINTKNTSLKPIHIWEALIGSFKIFINTNIVLVIGAIMAAGGMYELAFNGKPYEFVVSDLTFNIFVKYAMVLPIVFTIRLSDTIEKYTFNKMLETPYKNLKLYLWLFMIRDWKYEKMHLKAIKHLNQVIVNQMDLFQRQLSIRSKTQQFCSDLIFNFTQFYFHEMLTNRLPCQKDIAFQDNKMVRSPENFLDDFYIYFYKFSSLIGLTKQSYRLRQNLETTAGIANVLVKAKAFQMGVKPKYYPWDRTGLDLVEIVRLYEEIMKERRMDGDEEIKRLLQGMKSAAVFLVERESMKEKIVRKRERIENEEEEEGKGGFGLNNRMFKVFR